MVQFRIGTVTRETRTGVVFRGERAAAGPVSVEVVALQRLALLAEGRVLAVVRSTQGGGPAQRRGPRPAPRGPATQGGAAGHSRPAATRGTVTSGEVFVRV